MSRVDPHSYFDSEQPLTSRLDWRFSVDFENSRLKGVATLIFDAPASGALDLDTRGLSIRSVKTGEGRLVEYELGDPDEVLGTRLRLLLPQGTRQVAVEYETSPDATGLQWLSPAQTAGKQHPYLFSQCQPHHARTMIPLQDSPRVRIPYHAEATVPADLAVVMSAGRAGEKDGPAPGTKTFLFDMPQPIPSYLLALAVGNLAYKAVSGRSGVWAEPEVVDKAHWEFMGMEEMIQKAEGLFGPYEWDQYDVLVLPPSFPYGGMENPRITFLTPTLLAGDRSLVAVVAHELAHSWTGNLVTNATMNDFWLNEGFTVWAERRIQEAIKGKEYTAMAWTIGRRGLDEAFERFGEDSPYTRLRTDLAGVDPDSMYSEVPYEKGARFVALLEKTVGREAFDRFIAEYIKECKFTSITTEEFMDFLERKLPGVAARVGAQDWVYGTGLPANSPAFKSDTLERLEFLSSGWAEGRRPESGEVEKWGPDEVLIYLQGLPRELKLDECRWLDETFGLMGQGNYEILVEWLTIAASSGYEPAFDRIREVLSSVGRMKYIRPLYKALGRQPASRALAKDTFAAVKDSYHALTRRVAQEEMDNYPKD